MTIAEKLAKYAAEFSMDDMPPKAVEEAALHFADTIACMIAGSTSDTAKKVAFYAVNSNGGHPESSILGMGGARCKAAFAALANAVSAHCRDYDDMSTALNGHASAVLVPVALAMGERHHISGKGVVEAYMLGTEIDAVLGKMLAGSAYAKAWNTTCTLGAAGAAATACKLMGASQEDYANAIGLAVSSSGCVKENYGTSSKDVSVGVTAFLGIFSAEMASCGIAANPRIFEGENGIYAAVGIRENCGDIDPILEKHTSDFLSPGIVLKPYPTCRGSHNALDCFQELVRAHQILPEQIQRVVCRVQQTVLDTDKYPYPATREQAKFSIRYCLGKILYAGKLTTEDFAGTEALDPLAAAFMDKVDVRLDTGFDDARFGAEVEITDLSGKTYTARGRFASGDPLHPMSAAAIENKLRDCFAVKYRPERLASLLEILQKILQLQDICQLTERFS